MDETAKLQEDRINALEVHPAGGKQFFTNNELSKVGMYASHPPNNMREENVKNPYVACEIDNRSPWILFHEKEKLQSSATALIYKEYFNLNPTEYCSKEEFETFVDQESKSKEILNKYGNIFEQRFANIPEEVDVTLAKKDDPGNTESYKRLGCRTSTFDGAH